VRLARTRVEADIAQYSARSFHERFEVLVA
jgi:hypothetical protein